MPHVFFLFLLLLIFSSNYLRGVFVLWPLLTIAFFLLCFVVRYVKLRQQSDFLGQLKSHRKELRRGATVTIDNMVLRYDTPLRYYSISVGMLFTSLEIRSKFRPVEGETQLEMVWYSLATLITGWWSLTGPLQTMKSLANNLGRGGEKSVAELIDATYLRRNHVEGASNSSVITAT